MRDFFLLLLKINHLLINLYRYFCRSCWQWQHGSDPYYRNHKPLTRNSKSQIIIGVGPQQQQQQQTTQQQQQQQTNQQQQQQPSTNVYQS